MLTYIVASEDNKIFILSNINEDKITISKFNVNDESFENSVISNLPIRSSFVKQPPLLLFYDAKIWTILTNPNGDNLFGIDPYTGKFEEYKIFEDSSIVSGLISNANGDFWILYFIKNQGINTLMKFNPKNKNIFKLTLHKLEETPDFIYFDRLDHLWVGIEEWIDFSNEKIQVNRILKNPVFISNNIRPEEQYGLMTPFSMLQTDDGNYIFITPESIVHLDSLEGEWCIITKSTGILSAFEDEKNNTWLLVENILYMREPNKK